MTPAKPSRDPSSKLKPRTPQQLKPTSAFEKALHEMQHQPPTAFTLVSPRWLLGALGVVILAALVISWLALCFLYSQGSWQLLYHPAAAITRTPATLGLTYEPIHFAASETGVTQLTGWWIPNPASKHTVLYLHDANGNLSNTVDALAALHGANLSVFAIDYRGYGQSTPGRPNEKQLKQDADLAIIWLISTRKIGAKSILICGSALGADLAVEVAASHPELGGVILDAPKPDATRPIFDDPRSELVPAHWLVTDRYDLDDAASSLQVPSLWLLQMPDPKQPQSSNSAGLPPAAYQKVPSRKQSAWLSNPAFADPHFTEILDGWTDEL